MSKARRHRKLLQLIRHTHRRGWLMDPGNAYSRAWGRVWRDRNQLAYRRFLLTYHPPWRAYRSKKVWVPIRGPRRPLPSVHGKIR